MIEEMIKKAREAMDKAYAPYSNFHVGACVESEDGDLFAGCNVENASYGLTICAERSAIVSMISAGKKKIKSLVVMGAGNELCTPCGACRQFIREFAALDAPIYICDRNNVRETTNIATLLPKSFGPDNLTQQQEEKK